jgi:hypothetical protein
LGVRFGVHLGGRFGVPPGLILRPMSPLEITPPPTQPRCRPRRGVPSAVADVVRPVVRFAAIQADRDRLRRLRLPVGGGGR